MKRNTNPSTTLMWLVCLFMLVACTKNESKELEQPDTDYPKHLLVSVREASTTAYDSLFYGANKLASVASYNSPLSSSPSYEVRYTVGSNGQVKNARTFYDGVLDMEDTLSYGKGKVFVHGEGITELTINANGQIQQATFSEPGYQAQCTYEYTGKNPIRYMREDTTSYTTGSSVQSTLVVTIDYDDKPNPAYGMSRYNLLFDPVWNSGIFWPHGSMVGMEDFNAFDSYNNPKGVRVMEKRWGTTILDVTLNYTYQYDNETGFPVSQTVTVNGTNSGGTATFIKTFHFLYRQPQ